MEIINIEIVMIQIRIFFIFLVWLNHIQHTNIQNLNFLNYFFNYKILIKKYTRKLSKDFKFEREDLYELENELRLGELIFIPMNSFFWCKNKRNNYADIYDILGIFFRYINYKSTIRESSIYLYNNKWSD